MQVLLSVKLTFPLLCLPYLSCFKRFIYSFLIYSLLFSVYEEPGDAGVVAISYCRSRLITRYFWLGGLDSRSAVRQIIFMCGVLC